MLFLNRVNYFENFKRSIRFMIKKNSFVLIKPIITLFILSPLIAELLFGSTPASRSSQLIFESLFYGSAVLLIRELVRRHNLGWISIIGLGIAFGVIEECLLLQSAFNPSFLGNDLTFGRSLGVNWVWAEYIIGYHAIWSIAIPILITELIFPCRRTEPWLSNTGISIASVIYLLTSVAFYSTFVKMSGFTTSWIHYSIAAILALCLILFSVYLPIKITFKSIFKTPSPFLTGIIAFVTSVIWLILFSLIFKQGAGSEAWMVEAAGILDVIILGLFISLWVRQKWNDSHRFYVLSGGLMASMLFGLINLAQANSEADVVFQVVFIVITTSLLILLKKRLLNIEPINIQCII
jgi:hypothetical protein